MIALKIIARLLVAFAAISLVPGLVWLGPAKWLAVTLYWLALVSLVVPTGIIQKSRVAEAIVVVSCLGLVVGFIANRVDISWPSAFLVLGLLAKPGLVVMAELERKKASNQASDATSEPAPGGVSSAHQG